MRYDRERDLEPLLDAGGVQHSGAFRAIRRDTLDELESRVEDMDFYFTDEPARGFIDPEFDFEAED